MILVIKVSMVEGNSRELKVMRVRVLGLVPPGYVISFTLSFVCLFIHSPNIVEFFLSVL